MSTTQTSISDGSKTSSSPSQWSVLPDDLLGMIRSRVASPHDRVRFAVVCKSWRAAAARRPAPAPAIPLLLLSPRKNGTMKHLCGPQGYWDLCAPSNAESRKLVGSHEGGWVAAVADDLELVIMNIFSGVEVMFSGTGTQRMKVPIRRSGVPHHYKANDDVIKIVFSKAPTSSGCLLAVITDGGFGIALLCNNVSSCPKQSASGWAIKGWQNKVVQDITFCNGELYGLMKPVDKLVRFNIGMKRHGGRPVITINTYEMAIQRWVGSTSVYDRMMRVDYIFELHGKPAMAVWTCWSPEHEPFFKAFKLDDVEDGRHKWTEVTSFGDHALFLGPKGSKAVQVSAAVAHHGCFRRNHIYYYYSNPTYSTRDSMLSDHLVYSVTSEDGEYHLLCREDQNIGDGVGRTGYHLVGRDKSAMWLQHADF